jgi:hypothetical protein
MTHSQPTPKAQQSLSVPIQASGVLAGDLLCNGLRATAADIVPVVEVEEDIYSYTNAQNGAGPCGADRPHLSAGDRLFVSGPETIPDAKLLNNCRWMLFLPRTTLDSAARTSTANAEPSPSLPRRRRLFLRELTLGKGLEPNSGPASGRVAPTPRTNRGPWIAGTSMARQAGVHGTFL